MFKKMNLSILPMACCLMIMAVYSENLPPYFSYTFMTLALGCLLLSVFVLIKERKTLNQCFVSGQSALALLSLPLSFVLLFYKISTMTFSYYFYLPLILIFSGVFIILCFILIITICGNWKDNTVLISAYAMLSYSILLIYVSKILNYHIMENILSILIILVTVGMYIPSLYMGIFKVRDLAISSQLSLVFPVILILILLKAELNLLWPIITVLSLLVLISFLIVSILIFAKQGHESDVSNGNICVTYAIALLSVHLAKMQYLFESYNGSWALNIDFYGLTDIVGKVLHGIDYILLFMTTLVFLRFFSEQILSERKKA